MSPVAWPGAQVNASAGGRAYQLNVHERGPGDGPPILFLHGFPTSSRDWAKIAPAFRDRRAFYPDLLGFGRSEKPKIRYSYGLHAALLQDMLQKRGVNQVDVVAHDYSVTLAQVLLAQEHEPGALRIGRVVFLNGGVFGRLHRKQRAHRLLSLPVFGPWIARKVTPRALTQGLNAIAGRPHSWSAEEGAAHWRDMADNDGLARLPCLLHYIEDRKRYGSEWEAALIAAADRCGFVWGPDDPVSGAPMLDAVIAQIPNARTVGLPGVGHYPHWEAPNETAAAIRTLLEPNG